MCECVCVFGDRGSGLGPSVWAGVARSTNTSWTTDWSCSKDLHPLGHPDLFTNSGTDMFEQIVSSFFEIV